jgi:hypothetical protein
MLITSRSGASVVESEVDTVISEMSRIGVTMHLS